MKKICPETLQRATQQKERSMKKHTTYYLAYEIANKARNVEDIQEAIRILNAVLPAASRKEQAHHLTKAMVRKLNSNAWTRRMARKILTIIEAETKRSIK